MSTEHFVPDRLDRTNADTEPGVDERLADLADAPHTLGRLPSGRRVLTTVRGDDERVHVTSPEGRIELSIRFGKEGPILEFDAASLHFHAKNITLACEQLKTEVTGDMEELVCGRRTSASLGPTTISGKDVDLVADAGELRAKATEDLSIQGKNVLINC